MIHARTTGLYHSCQPSVKLAAATARNGAGTAGTRMYVVSLAPTACVVLFQSCHVMHLPLIFISLSDICGGVHVWESFFTESKILSGPIYLSKVSGFPSQKNKSSNLSSGQFHSDINSAA